MIEYMKDLSIRIFRLMHFLISLGVFIVAILIGCISGLSFIPAIMYIGFCYGLLIWVGNSFIDWRLNNEGNIR